MFKIINKTIEEDKNIEVHVYAPMGDILKLAEKEIYEAAIQQCRYNQSRTAKALGVSRGTLRTKLKEYFGDKYL